MEQKNYQILDDDYATYDLCFKVILIGDPGVGKSCLSIKATFSIITITLQSALSSFPSTLYLIKQ